MVGETFGVLDKDIKYEHLGHGFYDRKVESGDFKNVEGLESLSTACLLTIMTAFQEMSKNPTYKNFGCNAWSKIKKNRTRLTLMEIKNDVEKALESISRVKTVNNVEVLELQSKELKVNYSVTGINDQILTGGVYLGGT
jgi:hypothetical protein